MVSDKYTRRRDVLRLTRTLRSTSYEFVALWQRMFMAVTVHLGGAWVAQIARGQAGVRVYSEISGERLLGR